KRSTLPEIPNERGGPSTSPPSSHIHSSEYTPDEFYNNGGQPRSPERRYTLQEQSTRQRYQQYQRISPGGSQQTQSHDLDDRLDATGAEIEEEENTDFWQEVFVPKSGSSESPDVDALTSSDLTSAQNEPSEKVNPPLRRSESALETRKPKDYQKSESRGAGKPSLLNHSDRINRPRPKADRNNPMMRTDFEAEGQPPQRSKSLVKPERARPIYRRNTFHRQDYDSEIEKPRPFNVANDKQKLPERRNKKKWYQCELPSAWIMFSRCITCWAPPCLLSCFGLSDRLIQQAWREKIALVFIILIHCAAVGFLTFGITQAFCGLPPARVRVNELGFHRSVVLGKVYDIRGYVHTVYPDFIDDENLDAESNHAGGHDLSFLFQVVNQNCAGLLVNNDSGKLDNYFPCVPTDDYSTPNPLENVINKGCHLSAKSAIKQLKYVGDLYYDWDYVTRKDRDFI
ncbi:11563_t:CDS:2, partial [Acaulospora morrowiae]